MQRPIPALLACVAILLMAPSGARAVDATGTPNKAWRQISVTSDSARGWLPTVAQVEQARKATEEYFAAKDAGRTAEAYAFLAEINRSHQPFAEFAEEVRTFNLQAGPVKERRVAAVTWTKDPAQAPMPGVYAALDIVSQFTNIDRHCGYLVIYQSPSGGDFQVMREESNFMLNASAATIEKEQSRAGVDAAWSRLSANCPNYQPADSAPPLPEQSSSVGYSTVGAALRALKSRPGVQFATQAGWTIATDEAAKTIWSFAPASDPAYPAVVKREVVQTGTVIEMKMSVLCGASKPACDNLVRQFEQLNAQMKASMSRN